MLVCLLWACSGGSPAVTTDEGGGLPDALTGDGSMEILLPDMMSKDMGGDFPDYGYVPDLVDGGAVDAVADLVYPVDGPVPDVTPVDVPPEDVPVDMGPNWCAVDGGFGCACQFHEDCNSGWCVETPNGFFCSETCVEECPAEEWVCTLVQDPPDTIGVCMPAHGSLCNPCSLNQECQGTVVGQEVLCIDMGEDGSFCGGDCSINGYACPSGHVCENVTGVDGTKAKQCVPDSGQCSCSPLAVELSLETDCYRENEYGICEGARGCSQEGLSDCSAAVPAPEICNGEDDDCNGVSDDNLVQEECDVENEYGACPGTVLCVGGEAICQGPAPAAETCDGLDNNCDGTTDEDFGDCDEDGISDCIETDDDADGWPDESDNCSCHQNPQQLDFDSDGQGDACDPDDDNDGVPDDLDCAPVDAMVYPGVPEECNGADDDCDDLVDEGFLDTDQDGEADCVDLDDDGDGKPDNQDNCPSIANSEQEDADFDGQGDACDPDDDGDGYQDGADCGPLDKNVYPGAPELCDCKDNNCDGTPDEGYTDTDQDGIADCCEDDTDGDGVPDAIDNCPFESNPDQTNTDGDLLGDQCDPDDDNDGVIDALDCNPVEVKAYPNAPEVCDGVDNDCDGTVDNGYPDLDQDGEANCVDIDDDGDGVADIVDICPFFPDPLQFDTDKDGFGDACDGDDDGDGDFDLTDCEPKNGDVFHGALEFCNGKDDNCDGIIDETGAQGCVQLFPDNDGDGFGQEGGDKCLCMLEPPYTSFQGGDCDDTSQAVNPLVPEICNGKDDDCDGLSDPPGAQGCTDFFLDVDEDGFGTAADKSCQCGPEAPFSAQEVGDCDPEKPEVFPGNPESCDELDNDCNGVVDDVGEGNCNPFYQDGDGDGFGDDADFICSCQPKPALGYTASEGGDCNDSSPLVHPLAEEICGDQLDNNCDGVKEENCSPSEVLTTFVSAGGTQSGGSFSVSYGIGMYAAETGLSNPGGFSVDIGIANATAK